MKASYYIGKNTEVRLRYWEAFIGFQIDASKMSKQPIKAVDWNFRPIGIEKAFLWNNISSIKMFPGWRTDECSFTNFWCSIIKHNFLPVLNIRMRSWKYFALAILNFLENFNTWSKFFLSNFEIGVIFGPHFGTITQCDWKQNPKASLVMFGLFVSGLRFRKTRWMMAWWILIPWSVKK